MNLVARTAMFQGSTGSRSCTAGCGTATPGAFLVRPCSPRARIVASAGADSPQQRPVFKLTSSGPEMSLDDIRDAFEVCSLIPSPGERSQCYSCWGIDSDRMAAYYDLVLDLERSLEGGMVAHHMADPDEFQSVNTSMAE